MAGLFDSITMGARSLQTQRQGVDTAGHNLANVNTPGYARQRVAIEAATTPSAMLGTLGAGADAVRIQSVRDTILDSQIQDENSVTGSLEKREQFLQQALANLNENVDRAGAGASATDATLAARSGISAALSRFFNAAQNLSSAPASGSDKQVFLDQAQSLAGSFNRVSTNLDKLSAAVDQGLPAQVAQANDLLKNIADLNSQISRAELRSPGSANDLRDSRQLKLEQLSKLVPSTAIPGDNGAISVSISGGTALDETGAKKIELFAGANGRLTPRIEGSAQALSLTSGSIGGSIEFRDVDLAGLKKDLNDLASSVISEVNKIHAAGFAPGGSTGAALFEGDSAGNIKVNQALVSNINLLQTSGSATAGGDNKSILALAQLGAAKIQALGNQSFNGRQAQIVGAIGQRLAGATTQLEDQKMVQQTLNAQRESISGVSVDEEVSTMVKFQKAFEASAKFMSVADEMLDTILNMKR